MNKKISFFCTIMFVFLFLGIQTSFAATNTWELDLSTDYTLSNSASFNFNSSIANLEQTTLSHIWKINNATTYNWAYDVVVDWNYAYMTNYMRDSVSIIDISNKATPTLVTEIVNNNWTFRLNWAAGIVKDGNYLYIASQVSDALQIIDVSNPAAPTAAWQLVNATTLNWARWIVKSWNYVYITCDTYDALQIINVTNVAAPTITWTYRNAANWNLNWARDIKVVWNYAYIANYDRDSLAIMDISNPAAPVLTWQLQDATNLNWAHQVEISWNYAYVSAYLNNSVRVININNPALPTAVTNISWWSYSLTNPRDLLIDWNKLFITSFWLDAVNVADITNPATPVYITKILHNAANPLLDWVDGIFKVGNYIYTAVYNSDALEVLRFNYDTTSPNIISNIWFNYDTKLSGFSDILTGDSTWTITYQISKDNWTNWYYWNWSAWIVTTWWVANSNNSSVINTNISSFNNVLWWSWVFKFKAFFTSDWTQKTSLDSVTITTSTETILAWFCWKYYTWTSASPYVETNLKLIRNDSEVYFAWWNWTPDPLVPTDWFTWRWIWKIKSTATWVHNFRTYTDDWIRVYVNWTLVIDNWTDHGPVYDYGTYTMTSWLYYDVVVEFFENWWGATMQFDWQKPGDAAYGSLNWTYVSNDLCGVNYAPTDILLSNNIVYHLDPSGSAVWNLTTIDSNAGDTHTYSFVSWTGSSDNALFSLSGSTLYLNESPNYNLKSSYSIRLRTDDWNGWIYEEIILVHVVNLSSLNPWFCSSYYNGLLNAPFPESSLLYKTSTTNVFFNFWTWSPNVSVPADNFTAKYEWYLQTNETWIHSFQTRTDDWVRVYVDWTLVIDNWTNHSATINTWTISLSPWISYHIVVEYFEATGDSVMELSWMKPSQIVYSALNDTYVWHVWNCSITDTFAPTITYLNPGNDTWIYPWKNLNISLSYTDWVDGSWIDETTGLFSLYKWDWVSSWWSDISATYLSWSTINNTSANFSLVNLPYWKYLYGFRIYDNSWNFVTDGKIFYMDTPEFIISNAQVDIMWAKYWVPTNSNDLVLTVKTIWAWFDIVLDKWSDLTAYGLQLTDLSYVDPQTSVVNLVWNDIIVTENKNINTYGNKTTYNYILKFILNFPNEEQAAWNYYWDVDFTINMKY